MNFVDPGCRIDVNEAEAAATSMFMGRPIIFLPSCAVIAFRKIRRYLRMDSLWRKNGRMPRSDEKSSLQGMVFRSVSVVSNSLRLRTFRP